jgi:Raf kinase inhibitor-like YbhB/YbcL family protein
MAFMLHSSAFREGQPIPKHFTCLGKDISPALSWTEAPPGTKFYALVMDDPDAPRGTWTHWTWWDLPAATTGIPDGAKMAELGASEGTASNKATGYHGPCPPSGRHRYVFTLHALGEALGLPAGAPVEQVHAALKGKSLASARLMGTYQK